MSLDATVRPACHKLARYGDQINLRNPEFVRDPYSVYAAIREANGPIAWCNFPGAGEAHSGRWLVTGYAETQEILKTPQSFTAELTAKPERAVTTPWRPFYGEMQRRFLPHLPNDRHQTVRQAMSAEFVPGAIRSLIDPIEGFVERALKDLRARRTPFDFVQRVAHPIPFEVICEILGIVEGDRPRLANITKALVEADTILVSPKLIKVGTRAAAAFVELFDERIRGIETSGIIKKMRECASAGELSNADFISNVAFLMTAGHETTSNLLANLVYSLLENPAVRNQIVNSDKADRKKLIEQAVDEALRYDSPVHMIYRKCVLPTRIAGVEIGKDEIVMLCLGAANRDDRTFSNPDVFELTKSHSPALRFGLAFGAGMHICLGLQLARIEASIVLERFIDLLCEFKLDRSNPSVRHFDLTFRGFQGLNLTPLRD